MRHVCSPTMHGALKPTLAALLVLLFTLVGFAEGSAQDPDVPHVREMIQRRIESIDPRTGPPGTRVRVSSGEMPVITPVWVGLGATRTGFEAFHNIMTDMDGTFGVTVVVPEWAEWDRVHTFIVFDVYFRPIALSDVFHVTNEEGMVHRRGKIQDANMGCIVLEDLDGVGYALEGVTSRSFVPGSEVVVEGRIVLEGRCMTPQTIEVASIERVDPKERPAPGSP